MTFSDKDMRKILGTPNEKLVSPRYRVRMRAALYKNHFIYRPDSVWVYIGSRTIAEALGSVADDLPVSLDIDDLAWEAMEGS